MLSKIINFLLKEKQNKMSSSIDDSDLFRFDTALIGSRKEEDAESYFDRVWIHSTRKQKDAVARAYFGISSKKYDRIKKSLRHVGGGNGKELDQDFVQMLAAIDTFHDFDAINVDDVVRGKLPDDFKMQDLFREKALLAKLASKSSVVFRDRIVENPAFGCDLDKKMPLLSDDYSDIEPVFRAQHQSVCSMIHGGSRTIPVDVLTRCPGSNETPPVNDKKYEFFKLRQLASLLHVVRKMFSHGGRDVEFLVDGAAHPLLAITLGVKSMPGAASPGLANVRRIPGRPGWCVDGRPEAGKRVPDLGRKKDGHQGVRIRREEMLFDRAHFSFIYFSRDCRLASDESSETFDDFFCYTFLCSAAARQSLA